MFFNKIVPGMLLLLLLASMGVDGGATMMRNRELAQSAVGNQRDSGKAFCNGKAKEVQGTIQQLASLGCLIDICARGSGNPVPVPNLPPFVPAAPCECPSCSPVFLILMIVGFTGFFFAVAGLGAVAYLHFKKK